MDHQSLCHDEYIQTVLCLESQLLSEYDNQAYDSVHKSIEDTFDSTLYNQIRMCLRNNNHPDNSIGRCAKDIQALVRDRSRKSNVHGKRAETYVYKKLNREIIPYLNHKLFVNNRLGHFEVMEQPIVDEYVDGIMTPKVVDALVRYRNNDHTKDFKIEIQVDVWTGGAQSDRRVKYLSLYSNNSKNDFVAIMISWFPLRKANGELKRCDKKTMKEMCRGFETGCFVYIGGLVRILERYFDKELMSPIP